MVGVVSKHPKPEANLVCHLELHMVERTILGADNHIGPVVEHLRLFGAQMFGHPPAKQAPPNDPVAFAKE